MTFKHILTIYITGVHDELSLDQATGVLSVTCLGSSLDREVTDRYHILIAAEDTGHRKI